MKFRLSIIRRIAALIVLTVGTLYLVQPPFLKFDGWNFFPRIQVVPALLAGSAWILGGLLLFTLLFGRLYCSVICPLGIFQDLIMRLKKQRAKRDPALAKKRRAYRYEKPQHKLRYVILGIAAAILATGSTSVLVFLDPYSIYTRISNHLLHPIGTALNNLGAKVLNAFDNYALSEVHYLHPLWALVAISLLMTGILIVLSLKKDRFWCNAICPVGTLLGLFSRFSLFKVAVDQNRCIACGKCSFECKSHAINPDEQFRVDYSRCISCYNCIDNCSHKQAMQLRPQNPFSASVKQEHPHEQ